MTKPAVVTFLKQRALILTRFFIGAGDDRQAQEEYQRQRNFWGKLTPAEREVAGSWQQFPPTWAEQLRLLRWLLRADQHLAPLSHVRQLEITNLEDVASIIAATDTRPLGEIQSVQEAAAGYFAPLGQEFINRGVLPLDAGIGSFPSSQGESIDLSALTREELLAFMAHANARWGLLLLDRAGRCR